MDLEYWKQFESSGRIEDYLAFVSSRGQKEQRGEKARESSHAGIYMGDGDRAEAEPGGRVRQAYQSFDEGAR